VYLTTVNVLHWRAVVKGQEFYSGILISSQIIIPLFKLQQEIVYFYVQDFKIYIHINGADSDIGYDFPQFPFC
jgi:hypothetical protein